jgi:hypothetical protein
MTKRYGPKIGANYAEEFDVLLLDEHHADLFSPIRVNYLALASDGDRSRSARCHASVF